MTAARDLEGLRAALAAADGWGAGTVALAVIDGDGVIATHGSLDARLRWASVTKLLSGYVALIAVQRGLVSLDDPAGPPGATLRHLLAHASGYGPDGHAVLQPPGVTRIYSSTGIDDAAWFVAAGARRPFAALLREWVLDPLGMTATRLVDAPSRGLVGPVGDLASFGLELLRPRLLTPDSLALATTTAFPGLRGVLPGIGRFDPCDWGLAFELRDRKAPHWTGVRNGPGTFGHFGGSGSFLWADPVAGLALACLTDREFGPWALEAWPALSDAVLTAAAPSTA